jgi:hypothetical protein
LPDKGTKQPRTQALSSSPWASEQRAWERGWGQKSKRIRNSTIHYDSVDEHAKVGKTPKFGCEML